MERWAGKVCMVTGASSGIGAAIARTLVQHGMKVAGLARRVDRVKTLASEIKGAKGCLYPVSCDISKEEDILAAFSWIKQNLGGVDILVNNAGILHECILGDFKTEQWRQLLDVNVIGLSVCTREALKSMKERDVTDGHIIHLNSIAGHHVPAAMGYGMYSATKYAITALTDALRKELANQKSRVRVTSISPGLVETEIFETATGDSSVLKVNNCLKAQDIADGVVYALGAPAHVNIFELTIKPTGEIDL